MLREDCTFLTWLLIIYLLLEFRVAEVCRSASSHVQGFSLSLSCISSAVAGVYRICKLNVSLSETLSYPLSCFDCSDLLIPSQGLYSSLVVYLCRTAHCYAPRCLKVGWVFFFHLPIHFLITLPFYLQGNAIAAEWVTEKGKKRRICFNLT